MVVLYHYTSHNNLERIKREKVIRKSDESFHGRGVYLTALDPESHSKQEIGRNNWSRGGEARVTQGYVDCYVMINIPETDYRLEECEDRQDKWRYTTDLRLDDYRWESGTISEWKVKLLALAGLGIVGLSWAITSSN